MGGAVLEGLPDIGEPYTDPDVGTVMTDGEESYPMLTEHKSSRSSVYNVDKASMY